jgi:hypothetical protein
MRKQITEDQLLDGLNKFNGLLDKQLEKKGFGTFASKHEILGALLEEVREFENDVHSQRTPSDELYDIAIVAIFGAICMDNRTTEW